MSQIAIACLQEVHLVSLRQVLAFAIGRSRVEGDGVGQEGRGEVSAGGRWLRTQRAVCSTLSAIEALVVSRMVMAGAVLAACCCIQRLKWRIR